MHDSSTHEGAFTLPEIGRRGGGGGQVHKDSLEIPGRGAKGQLAQPEKPRGKPWQKGCRAHPSGSGSKLSAF